MKKKLELYFVLIVLHMQWTGNNVWGVEAYTPVHAPNLSFSIAPEKQKFAWVNLVSGTASS